MRAEANQGGWDIPLKVAGWLLLLLGGLKCLSAALAWDALGQRTDPVLDLPLNGSMLAAGLIECGLAWTLLVRGWTPWGKAWIMVLLAQGWLIYQWLHAQRAAGGSCPCLGHATIWFPWLARFEREVLTSLTLWFFLVGTALIARHCLCKTVQETS